MNSIMQMFNLNVYSSGDNHVLLSSKKRAQWNGPSHSESKGLEFKIVGSKRCVTLTKTVAGLSSRLLNRERERAFQLERQTLAWITLYQFTH